MTEEELSGKMLYKISTHKKYGIKFLAIHGIGKDNIAKIRNIIEELEMAMPDLKPKIAQDDNIMQVTIYF